MTTWANESKNSSTFTNVAKSLVTTFSNLLMESGDALLMESGDKMLLESAGVSSSTAWSNITKS